MTVIFLTLVGTVVGGLLVAEFVAEAPRLANVLLRHAIRWAPSDLKDRLSEEWQAHLDDVAGGLSKILCACGFWHAAAAMTLERTGAGLGMLVRLLVTHPRAVWLAYVGWRNWSLVAYIMRKGGIAVPVSPLELSYRQLLAKFKCNPAYDLSEEMKPFLEWMGHNPHLAMFYFSIATRKRFSQVWPNATKELDQYYEQSMDLLARADRHRKTVTVGARNGPAAREARDLADR